MATQETGTRRVNIPQNPSRRHLLRIVGGGVAAATLVGASYAVGKNSSSESKSAPSAQNSEVTRGEESRTSLQQSGSKIEVKLGFVIEYLEHSGKLDFVIQRPKEWKPGLNYRFYHGDPKKWPIYYFYDPSPSTIQTVVDIFKEPVARGIPFDEVRRRLESEITDDAINRYTRARWSLSGIQKVFESTKIQIAGYPGYAYRSILLPEPPEPSGQYFVERAICMTDPNEVLRIDIKAEKDAFQKAREKGVVVRDSLRIFK